MKKPLINIARLLVAFCLVVVTLSSCESGDEEIFENVELETEQETDEEDEKKSGPV